MRAIGLLSFLAACATDIQVSDKENIAPAAVINAPATGTAFLATEAVEFVGTVSDANGLDDLTTVLWTSTLDGELANLSDAPPDASGVTRTAQVLSSGNHAITLSVTDSAGNSASAVIDVSIGEAREEPIAEILDPANFQQFVPGDTVRLSGTVSDGQQAAETLDVTWIVTDNTTNTVVQEVAGPPTAGGATEGEWLATAQGNFRVGLSAGDSEGNIALAEVLVVVVDPQFFDADGDTFTPASGDCDDTDATVNPNADETCGDLTDHDCNGAVDDKDLDNDAHIDEDCVNYGGALPVDDCDDGSAVVYTGAFELPDGVDNDCDGAIDNGGPSYDDDGDCFCEIGPCTGTVDEPACPVLLDGDCDDTAIAVNPDASDDPDRGYVDANCDSIDGDLANSVFLDPIGGSDANSGLDPVQPKRSLSAALDVAVNASLPWVLIADGTVPFAAPTDGFAEGVNLAGGYDALWVRSAVVVPTIEVPANAQVLYGWRVPTAFHQLRIQALDANAVGGSSIALVLDDAQDVTLVDCEIVGGNGYDGAAGVDGLSGGAGAVGARGDDGCQDAMVFCSHCPNPHGGIGGSACSGSGSG
ncbi:MAG: MopE-related protein, partial [Myxococcota bacterium]